MTIGKIKIKTPVLLAPMAGVTDYPFRILCKEMGAGIVYSEFVSADGIIRENSKTLDLIKFEEKERPIGIQIFGSDPEIMSQASRFVLDSFKPDLIDINYGCPVPKITKKGAGSAALQDLCLMDDITAAVVESVREIPVTVKMRAGWNENSIVIPEAGHRLENIGVKAITLHPRTTQQRYTGKANWTYIKELKNACSIPIIGNGDVCSASNMLQMFDEGERAKQEKEEITFKEMNLVLNLNHPVTSSVVQQTKDHQELIQKRIEIIENKLTDERKVALEKGAKDTNWGGNDRFWRAFLMENEKELLNTLKEIEEIQEAHTVALTNLIKVKRLF